MKMLAFSINFNSIRILCRRKIDLIFYGTTSNWMCTVVADALDTKVAA